MEDMRAKLARLFGGNRPDISGLPTEIQPAVFLRKNVVFPNVRKIDKSEWDKEAVGQRANVVYESEIPTSKPGFAWRFRLYGVRPEANSPEGQIIGVTSAYLWKEESGYKRQMGGQEINASQDVYPISMDYLEGAYYKFSPSQEGSDQLTLTLDKAIDVNNILPETDPSVFHVRGIRRSTGQQ